MNKTIPRTYLSSFVRISSIIFTIGALLTAAGFYFVLRDQGVSYADNFKLLAGLNRSLVNNSLLLFACTLLLSVAGIITLAIVYSHRVAGPLYKLGLHTRKIASGNLAEQVHLRSTDVLHVLADDLNGISGHYRDILAQVRSKARELAVILDEAEKSSSEDSRAETSGVITQRIDEINALLNQIKP